MLASRAKHLTTAVQPQKKLAIAELKKSHHQIKPNYKAWGLAGCKTADEAKQSSKFAIGPVTSELKNLSLQRVQKLLPQNSDFKLAHAVQVPYDQGPNHPKLNGILLRFTQSGQPKFGGEHISFIIDSKNGRLLGMTKMLEQCDGQSTVRPDLALQTAYQFLQQHAPNLIDPTTMPSLSLPENLQPGEGVDIFDPDTGKAGFSLGEVSVHWIADHPEKLKVRGLEFETHGMKVKMRYNDDSERYVWAIVDKNKQVQVFENNIFWDFANFKRETQMWLHDGWLQAHGLNQALGQITQ